jgi:iron-sulfur cluster repair protein YtfE (RIC family)
MVEDRVDVLPCQQEGTHIPTIQVDASHDQLLRAVEQLQTDELDRFVAQVVALRAARLAPSLPHDEGEFLQRIAATLPHDLQQRFDVLVEQRRQEALTTGEHAELISLTSQVEQIDADRAAALVQLATLRGTFVSDLMQTLAIEPPPDV